MSKQKIKIPISAEIKRCYIDKSTLNLSLPCCGKERPVGDDYLSYPVVDEETHLGFYCPDCDKNYIIPIEIKAIGITIETDLTKIEEDYNYE